MAKRQGRYTVLLPNRPCITGSGAVVGKTEGEGPLGKEFDQVCEDATFGTDSWEKAESALQEMAVKTAIQKANRKPEEIDMIFSGDLLDQCIGSTFGLRQLQIPFAGLYGACSTMALSMAVASVFADSGAAPVCVAATSSHFCSAEKQFRFPLEYGGQRTPTAQRTATASGAVVIENKKDAVGIEAACFGKIQDLGIKDANNMGAAMAPAACDTIYNFLKDTKTEPKDYDLILTGDLGKVGADLLHELMMKNYEIDLSQNHQDCGLMLYDLEGQDVHAGGSGCGCSGSVVCSNILRRLREGELKRVLFAATGALMSPVSSMQGETIPSISHCVLLTSQNYLV